MFAWSQEMSLHGEDKPQKHKTAALDFYNVEAGILHAYFEVEPKIFGVI